MNGILTERQVINIFQKEKEVAQIWSSTHESWVCLENALIDHVHQTYLHSLSLPCKIVQSHRPFHPIHTIGFLTIAAMKRNIPCSLATKSRTYPSLFPTAIDADIWFLAALGLSSPRLWHTSLYRCYGHYRQSRCESLELSTTQTQKSTCWAPLYTSMALRQRAFEVWGLQKREDVVFEIVADNLHPDVKYITSWISAGWSTCFFLSVATATDYTWKLANDVMTYVSLASRCTQFLSPWL